LVRSQLHHHHVYDGVVHHHMEYVSAVILSSSYDNTPTANRDVLLVCVRGLCVLVGHLSPQGLSLCPPHRAFQVIETADRTAAQGCAVIAFSRILLATVWKLPVVAVCSLRTTGLSVRLAVGKHIKMVKPRGNTLRWSPQLRHDVPPYYKVASAPFRDQARVY
jgi:hypothetical protein